MKIAHTTALILALGLIIAGCTDPGDLTIVEQTHGCQGEGCWPSCADDSECPSPQLCIDGSCLDCDGDGCEPLPGTCADDSECAEGTYCLDERCVEDAIECFDSLHCPEGTACVDGACVPPDLTCATHEDCGGMLSGRGCGGGLCRTALNCADDAECMGDEICGPTGTCGAPCVVAADCWEGFRCDGGRPQTEEEAAVEGICLFDAETN